MCAVGGADPRWFVAELFVVVAIVWLLCVVAAALLVVVDGWIVVREAGEKKNKINFFEFCCRGEFPVW